MSQAHSLFWPSSALSWATGPHVQSQGFPQDLPPLSKCFMAQLALCPLPHLPPQTGHLPWVQTPPPRPPEYPSSSLAPWLPRRGFVSFPVSSSAAPLLTVLGGVVPKCPGTHVTPGHFSGSPTDLPLVLPAWRAGPYTVGRESPEGAGGIHKESVISKNQSGLGSKG